MAIALVQTGTEISVTAGTSDTIMLTSVAAGNLLIVVADDVDGNTVTFTVTDDKSNTWLQAVHNDNSGYSSTIWYCLNAAAGTTVITVTASGTTDFIAQAQEWSGGTWTLDTTSSIDGAAGTSHVCSASASVIDTTGADLVVCNSAVNNGTSFGARTPGSGYTDFSGPGLAEFSRAMWQYQAFTTAQANEQGAFTSANSKATAAVIAAFKCALDCSPCWWPCCDSCECTPAPVAYGDIGSESGDECTSCANTIIDDDFSTLSGDWENPTDVTCLGNTAIGGPFGWTVSGGIATAPGGPSLAKRSFPRPPLSGFCVEVEITVVNTYPPTGFGTVAISVGFGRYFQALGAFFGTPSFASYDLIDEEGCVAVGATYSQFGGTFADGDIISFIIRDQGGGDNGDGSVTCSVCYQVNGVTIRVEENVTFCFPDPMWAGVSTGSGDVDFDDFRVRTN